MRISNPKNMSGQLLLTKVFVDNDYIKGTGVENNVLTFDGIKAIDEQGNIISSIKKIKAGAGISFFTTENANQLTISSIAQSNVQDFITSSISSNATDSKIPSEKAVYDFVKENIDSWM